MASPGQSEAPRIGTTVGDNYHLVRLISAGGMGRVFEAIELRLERRVAVKIMTAELTENREALARFKREVKLTSKLAHPHVVHLLDFGTLPSGEPYLVTEFLEGEDLEETLMRIEKMPLPRVLHIVRQVASALTAIHGKGVVHRDLKPGNVFLLRVEGAQDFVKLVDFGISKMMTSNTQLTHPSAVFGTPEYMSPEQASGRVDEVDHRSDQWALACMIWRMLSGWPPFNGHHVNELLDAIVHDEPPPLGEFVPWLPPAVEKVLRRGLCKRQSQRYPTIAGFLRAFEAATESAR